MYRCVLITNGNLLSMISLGGWMRAHGDQIAKVYVTHKLPSQKSNVAGVWSMWRQSGWDYTYFKIWMNIVAPRRLRAAGLPVSVADYLRRRGLPAPVQPVDSVNTPAVVDEVRALRPDLIVSFSATQRFRQPLIDAAAQGAINTHFGALPAYAGLSPYYWHLHNREPRFGVTLHRITLKLDAGPIIEQTTGDMSGWRSALDVALAMASCVSPMLNRFFDGATSFADGREQDLARRSYFGHPTRAETRAFHAHGFSMLSPAAKSELRRRVEALAAQRP
ncbi:MAG: Bifunctional polymyxin resistance protein ArnA [Phycisphaerae bacterium]|nr:Bifunctional polymyxin resistance protein ArnA [Phycisphaerae bacterium]